MCFCVQCAISCPRTPANSASFFIACSAPVVMKMKPPGVEKALMIGVSMTAKCHSSVGLELYAATVLPTSVTYCCNFSFLARG